MKMEIQLTFHNTALKMERKINRSKSNLIHTNWLIQTILWQLKTEHRDIISTAQVRNESTE